MQHVFRNAWGATTSADRANWTSSNPAYGQCAVTALVVQELLGGDILRFQFTPELSHYANRLPGGDMLDLTWEQFSPDEKQRYYQSRFEAPELRTREQLLSNLDTEFRYHVLKSRVVAVLSGNVQ